MYIVTHGFDNNSGNYYALVSSTYPAGYRLHKVEVQNRTANPSEFALYKLHGTVTGNDFSVTPANYDDHTPYGGEPAGLFHPTSVTSSPSYVQAWYYWIGANASQVINFEGGIEFSSSRLGYSTSGASFRANFHGEDF